MQKLSIRRLEPPDVSFLPGIINFYALHTMADFSDRPHTLEEIKALTDTEDRYPKYVAAIRGEIVGFAVAYPFRPEPTFADTVKFTYWIKPSFTGKGVGTKLHKCLERDCIKSGIRNILVNISSDNAGSIRFHERRDFVHCGCFRQVVRKFGKNLDLIWLQKSLIND